MNNDMTFLDSILHFWISYFNGVSFFLSQFVKSKPDIYDIHRKDEHWKHWGGEDENGTQNIR